MRRRKTSTAGSCELFGEAQLSTPRSPLLLGRASLPLIAAALTALTAASTEAAAVAAGKRHSAIVVAGEVWSWGSNQYGQIGDGTSVDRPLPTKAPGLGSVVAVATGGHHTLAITSGGGVVAWGLNWEGALGDGVPRASL
jgi:alpha-tubulin suppressor-like RCC1 family protein